MTELSTTSQYQIPTSPEVATSYIETTRTPEIDRAYQDAMNAASDLTSVNPEIVDTSRVESFGGATITAAQAKPEVYFDPTNPIELNRVAEAVMTIRQAELRDRNGYDLAA